MRHTIAALLLALSPHTALAKTVTITETFDADCDALAKHNPTDTWELPVWQWGGNVNGGVSPLNVCTHTRRLWAPRGYSCTRTVPVQYQ